MNSQYSESTVQRLFEEQVERTPNQVALVDGAKSLTYRELNARANRLAHRLSNAGLREERIACVLIPRSFDTVTALLGVLKTGGAYAVLDPAYPEERLQQMINACRPQLLVTAGESESIPRVSAELDGGVISIHERTSGTAGESVDNPEPTGLSDSIAYLTFTSGTTGGPKAVAATHASILNGLSSSPFRSAADGEVCALSSSLALGFSVSRLYLPLLTGVPVQLISDREAKDPRRFVEACARGGATSIGMVTSQLRQILSLDRQTLAELAQVHTVVTGGAPVTEDLVEAFASAMPDATLVNGYAMSEAGGAVAISVRRGESDASPLSIGKPFANTSVYLLDDKLKPVDEGAVGEIYVEADHLSRGYYLQPGLTASRFVANPVSSRSGARMYRTGDVARLLSDGELEFVGRLDEEVKIRGYRVSVGEVENVLQMHPQVNSAAVWVRKHHDDELQLVAYIVPAEESLTTASLREFVTSRLPNFMVPSVFVWLDVLPLTLAGKVDREALPSSEPERPITEGSFVPPRSALEGTITEIWADALGLDQVGIHDDFLELGGDSLISTQIVARIWETFGTEVPFETIFERPTVAALVDEFFPDAVAGAQVAEQ